MIARGSNYTGLVGYEGSIYTSTLAAIIRIDIGTSSVTSVAGMGSPSGVNALWREGDNFYGYGDHSILKINAISGEITTFAGRYRDRWIFADGIGTDAEFANLQGMWGDTAGHFVRCEIHSGNIHVQVFGWCRGSRASRPDQ